jgi:two-component system, chemotaxis family, sensor kinase CheA
MTTDINQIVWDAFRIEHREQLEQIRTLLDALEPGTDVGHDPRLADAFRLAHSFKGGARVCDLHDAERLGHGLETVLERLSRGELAMSRDVDEAIALLLDSIEDWMAALEADETLPDTSAALAAADHVLAGEPIPPPGAPTSHLKLQPLMDVFRSEFAEHAAWLRESIAEWTGPGATSSQKQLTEAIRRAHTLAGAAALVDMPSVEQAARSLEKLFVETRQNDRPFNTAARAQSEAWLGSAEKAMRDSLEAMPPPARTPNARDGAGALSTAQETVRISVGSLERLTSSSAQMLGEIGRLTHFTRQFDEFQQEIQELVRERGAARRITSCSLAKLSHGSEFEPLAKHLEQVDRQLASLARRARRLSVDERRVVWLLRTRTVDIVHGVHEARLVPAHTVFQGFRKLIRDLAKSEGKEIELVVEGFDVRADRMVLQELKDPLMHVLRNCVTHGVESPDERSANGKPSRGRVSLRMQIVDGRMEVVVEDDGRGIDLQQLRSCALERCLITQEAADEQANEDLLSIVFEPGFTTLASATKLAGRGMGLSIVQNAVARLQGHVKLERRKGGGLGVVFSVPVTVSTHRVLLVDCLGQTFAIPTRYVERLLRIPGDKLETLEGRPMVNYQRRPVPLKSLAGALGMSPADARDNRPPVIAVAVLKVGSGHLAISVDALLEQRDALIHSLDEFAASSLFADCILLEDGRIAPVVQPDELLLVAERAGVAGPSSMPVHDLTAAPAEVPKILIVDDSFTTRTLEKSILEAHGYRVGVAVDGREALVQLRQEKFAAVISDIEMPAMDGFALLDQMKSDPRLRSIPVILVTSRDRQEDQRRGLDLGAEAYIVKRKFDHQELLGTIGQLVGYRSEKQLA